VLQFFVERSALFSGEFFWEDLLSLLCFLWAPSDGKGGSDGPGDGHWRFTWSQRGSKLRTRVSVVSYLIYMVDKLDWLCLNENEDEKKNSCLSGSFSSWETDCVLLFGSAVHGEDFFFFLSSPFLSEILFFSVPCFTIWGLCRPPLKVQSAAVWTGVIDVTTDVNVCGASFYWHVMSIVVQAWSISLVLRGFVLRIAGIRVYSMPALH